METAAKRKRRDPTKQTHDVSLLGYTSVACVTVITKQQNQCGRSPAIKAGRQWGWLQMGNQKTYPSKCTGKGKQQTESK